MDSRVAAAARISLTYDTERVRFQENVLFAALRIAELPFCWEQAAFCAANSAVKDLVDVAIALADYGRRQMPKQGGAA